jgi:iron complex transport system ATP-binding protein
MALLRRLNRESGITIIAVTHDINSAVLAGNHVLALKDGRVAFRGPARDVLDGAALADIYGTEFCFLRHEPTGTTVVAPQGLPE